MIAVGKRADLVILDASSPIELAYRWGDARAHAVVARGRRAYGPGMR